MEAAAHLSLGLRDSRLHVLSTQLEHELVSRASAGL